jgi:hypothetical protein
MTTTQKQQLNSQRQSFSERLEEVYPELKLKYELLLHKPTYSETIFRTFSRFGKQVLFAFGASTKHCERSVQDAQIVLNHLHHRNQERHSEFLDVLIQSVVAFVIKAFHRRFRGKLELTETDFSVTIPLTGVVVSPQTLSNLAGIYRNQLIKHRDHWAEEIRPEHQGSTSIKFNVIPELIFQVLDYYSLTCSWCDKVAILDDLIQSFQPSPSEDRVLKLLGACVAEIIIERTYPVSWSFDSNEQIRSVGSIPNRILMAVNNQVTDPNGTYIFDLLESLSDDFRVMGDPVGHEGETTVREREYTDVFFERLKSLNEFGQPPLSRLSTMCSES